MDWTTLPVDQQRRIEKLFDRAAHIGSQAHLDKIIQSFPEQYQAQLLSEIQDRLPVDLKSK